MQNYFYYPFGMYLGEYETSGYWDEGEDAMQPYKYSGKELDRMLGINLYDSQARQYDAVLGRFTSVDPLAEKSFSESPYVYVSNNPIIYIDPDGREKLNGMHNQSRPKDAQLVDFRYKQQKIDNGMIHIYAHGSPMGLTYSDKTGTSHIRNSKDLIKLLNAKSTTWKTRQKGETIYIMLHSCQTGEHSYNLYDEAYTGTSFGQELSESMPNTIIGAPSSNLQIDAKGEKVIDRSSGKIGTWNFYKNGKKLSDTRSGEYQGNPDMIDYNRPNLGGKSSTQSVDLREFLMDAAKAGATINIRY